VAEAVWTRSARAQSNERARAAAFAGALAVLVIPAAIALAAYSSLVKLTYAAAAIPLAAILGLVAIALSRSARRYSQISLGRIGGMGLARAGSIMGMLGLYLAAMAVLAIGFFGLLLLFD
jgi:multidrug efflux pump subunit AcrB